MELIDKGRLKKAFIADFWEHYTQCHDSDQVDLFEMFMDDLEECPTVDAEPVRRGKWIEVGSGFNYHFECSECGWKDGYPFNDRHKYCPNCGAKMTGGIDND